MNKETRDLIKSKYNNKCAYTGKDLDSDWQIDHVRSRYIHSYFYTGEVDYLEYKKQEDVIDNLMPTLRIVNHYKRALDLEGFRKYMMTFHIRLSKLPKNTRLEKTKKRIEYMNKVAAAFDITTDKPFSGKFYFETFK